MDYRECECASCGYRVTFIGTFPDGFPCPKCKQDNWYHRYELSENDVKLLQSLHIEPTEQTR